MQIGKLTAAMPKAKNQNGNTCNSGETSPKEVQLADIGLTRQQANRFETLAKHPEIVEQAKESARRRNDMVNRSNVLKAIADSVPPKRDIVEEAKRDYERFQQAKAEDVVNIHDAQQDKQNKWILRNETAIKVITSISKAFVSNDK